MNKFDLMKQKPQLDIATLNFIWDGLWRSNACCQNKNAEQRIRYSERERIMKLIEEFANQESEDSQA